MPISQQNFLASDQVFLSSLVKKETPQSMLIFPNAVGSRGLEMHAVLFVRKIIIKTFF